MIKTIKKIQRDRDSHYTWFLIAMGLSILANILSNGANVPIA